MRESGKPGEGRANPQGLTRRSDGVRAEWPRQAVGMLDPEASAATLKAGGSEMGREMDPGLLQGEEGRR